MNPHSPDSHEETQPTESSADSGQSARTRPGGRRRQIVFSCLAVALVLILAEAVLRLVGFSFVPVPVLVDTVWGPEQVASLNERAQRNMYRPDDLLFWSMTPGLRIDIRLVNQKGVPNEPVVVPKPEGTFRIVCLGDSCTVMGPAAYPTLLQRQLNVVQRPDRCFDVIGAGVFSYSSLQGLRFYRDRIGDVRADLVTVYYGWNDLFLSGGHPDKELRSRTTQAPGILRLFRRFRVYQLVRKAVNTVRAKSAGEGGEAGLVRVAPEDYRENISAIADLVRNQGGRPLLMTFPTSLQLGRVPPFYVQNKQVESGEAMIVRHRQYNEIVRSVAAEKKADLLDLAKIFDAYPKAGLFTGDAIHPNLAGRHLIAQSLIAKLVRMGILSEEERRRIQSETTYDSRVPHLLRSRITVASEPLRAVVGRPLELVANLENTGDTLWYSDTDDHVGAVSVGFLVYDSDRKTVLAEKQVALSRDMPPGGSAAVRCTIDPFPAPGRFMLAIAPIARDVTWFQREGDRQTTVTLIVDPAGR